MKFLSACLILFLCSSFYVNAQLSSKRQFVQLLANKVGHYSVQQSNSSLCTDAILRFIDKANPEQGVMLSKQIMVGPFHNGTQTTKKEGYCFITSSYKYKTDGVIHSIKTSRCANPSNEQTLTQSFKFKDNNLHYSLKEKNISCDFKLNN
ncbi:hypothetical protein J8L70_08900 [Pseudoalteromonas sp. MMG010]|uniref:hypothetical protein n=1 Tax=Pseudoalteromonas sp. MMG010 TaxID=2822685 RepID=UPI001B3A62A5|nr:hypothetical protein [Pseudoalteromonas sp. MMG010]MBQ4833353.1 hypothetical protein [Pseudoalteromonas sp. MMG010]